MYSWKENELTHRHNMIKLQVCLHVNCGAGSFCIFLKVPCQIQDKIKLPVLYSYSNFAFRKLWKENLPEKGTLS